MTSDHVTSIANLNAKYTDRGRMLGWGVSFKSISCFPKAKLRGLLDRRLRGVGKRAALAAFSRRGPETCVGGVGDEWTWTVSAAAGVPCVFSSAAWLSGHTLIVSQRQPKGSYLHEKDAVAAAAFFFLSRGLLSFPPAWFGGLFRFSFEERQSTRKRPHCRSRPPASRFSGLLPVDTSAPRFWLRRPALLRPFSRPGHGATSARRFSNNYRRCANTF